MSEPCLQFLPQVLSGPILRHTRVNRLVLWMVGSCSLTLRMHLYLTGSPEPWFDRVLTGDQIYADDVAGPMLKAIHCLIERLGLYEETLSGSCVSDSKALRQNPDTGVPPMCC